MPENPLGFLDFFSNNLYNRLHPLEGRKKKEWSNVQQKKRSLRAVLAALMAVVMLVALAPAAFAAEAGQKQITIIGTSDVHGNIWGYSYENNKETSDGLARVYTYVQQVRAQNPNTVLVDAGDSIQGTIMTDDLYSSSNADHPVIAAMNAMGYDAWTLGNHEFNFGLDNLKTVMAQAKFPVLAANITYKSTGKLFTGAAYTIVERSGVKIAIIGVDTPNIPTWDGAKVDQLTFAPMAAAVKSCIKEIGSKADIIMVCAHAGLTGEFTDQNNADAAQAILDANPEVDVLQVGHYHTTIAQKEGSVVVGGVKNGAPEVARFDLTLNASNQIVDTSVSTVSMKDYEPSSVIRSLPAVKTAHEKTIAYVNDNVLGTSAAKFQPANEIKGIPAGKLQDSAVMDLINKVQLENSGADVSAAALFSDTSDIPAGNLTYANIFNIYKFTNVLYKIQVTGAQLKAYMEWSAACYNQWKPGDVSISFNPDKPGYLYDMFAGVNYEIDLSQPAGSRIKNVTFKGAALKDDQTLTLAVNDYRFSSGLKANHIVPADTQKLWESSESIRDMLVAYLKKNSPIQPSVDNNWKITGVDLQTSSADRAKLVSMVNSGVLAVPYNKSLNLTDDAGVLAMLNNASVNGKSCTVASMKAADGATYYRLRDLAIALKGTGAAFNVTWKDGVVVTTGTAYADDALPLTTDTAYTMTPITLTVNGKAVKMTTLSLAKNNYVSAAQLAQLVGSYGVSASEKSGVLTVTAK
jgi:5''-nucleotidase/2'',3''-cyclic phosphodiesterase and related esterases